MKDIQMPTKEARKEILKVLRGLNENNKNTIYVDIWTGEIQGFGYYLSDKGEYISNPPKDCFVFHVNGKYPFIGYSELDEMIKQQKDIIYDSILEELKFIKNEYGRKIEYFESEEEFEKQQKYMQSRLEELEEI